MYNGNYEVASLVYIYICICMFKNDIFPCGSGMKSERELFQLVCMCNQGRRKHSDIGAAISMSVN